MSNSRIRTHKATHIRTFQYLITQDFLLFEHRRSVVTDAPPNQGSGLDPPDPTTGP